MRWLLDDLIPSLGIALLLALLVWLTLMTTSCRRPSPCDARCPAWDDSCVRVRLAECAAWKNARPRKVPVPCSPR